MNTIEIVFWSNIGFLFAFYIVYYALMVWTARKPHTTQKKPITPSISLIIPTFNEEDTITQKLNNVKELDYPKNLIETFVVDSASTDNTCKLVRDFIAKNIDEYRIFLVELERRKGKASALNEAWELCNGEVVVLSDADSLLNKDAFRQVASNFADPLVGAVSGRQILLNAKQSQATLIERGYRDLFEVLRIGESQLDSTPIFHGELAAFRRNLIEHVSNDSVADDTELAIRVRKKGYRAIYDTDARFYEYAPPTLKARTKQKRRRGFGLIQQFVRFRHIMFDWTFGKYGLIIFPCEFFMHIVSPFLVVTLPIIFVLMLVTNSFCLPVLATISSAILIIALGFIISLKFATPTRRTPNPLSIMLAFLHSQLCLLLSYFSIINQRAAYQWEKIKDIRALWKS